MTDKLRIKLRRSEIRSRLAEIAGVEAGALTDELRTEAEALRGEYSDSEIQLRSALLADPDDDQVETATGSAEDRQLRQLEQRAAGGLGEIFDTTLGGRAPEGAIAELQQHLGIDRNQVPLSVLRDPLETRAVTPAPTDTESMQQPVLQNVFPASVTAFLGIPTPTVGAGDSVFPVLGTAATVGGPHADSTAVSETTGAFTATALAPERLQASFFYRRTDRARFRDMSESLRENLSMALMDALDAEVIAGTGHGLLNGTVLANHNVSAQTDFANYISNLAFSRVDGAYAMSTMDVRIVMGSATYAHAGGTYRANEADVTALGRLMDVTGGVRVSAHVPAAASNKQNVLCRRGMRADYAAPIWEGVSIVPDEVTKAGSGEIVVTAFLLANFALLRSDGFYKQQTQHA